MKYYFEKWKTRSILPYYSSDSRASLMSHSNQNIRPLPNDDIDEQNYYSSNSNSNSKRRGILYNEGEEGDYKSRKKTVRKTILSMLETMKWYNARLENERLKNQELNWALHNEKATHHHHDLYNNNISIPPKVQEKSYQSSPSINYPIHPNHHHDSESVRQQDYHRPNMYQQQQQQQPSLNRNWIPIFSYLIAIGSCILFVYQVILFKQNYGSILSLSPFNAMLGPNSETMVKSGALFTSCIRKGNLINSTTTFDCGSTSTPLPLTSPSWTYFIQPSTNGACHLQELCSLTTFSKEGYPDQHYRFLSSLLVNSGFVQLIINVTILLTFCASVERKINPLRYAFVWIISGIFGSVFVSLFLNESIVLTGCFGSIFGIIGLSIVDLFTSWQQFSNNMLLLKHILLIVSGGIIGYFPGYNNFNHLGGLIAGILIGVMVLPASINLKLNKKKGILIVVIKVLSFIILTIAFYLMLSSFYSNRNLSESCPWCHYVSCLPFSKTCSI